MPDSFIERTRAKRAELIADRERLEGERRRLAERIDALDGDIAQIDGHLDFYVATMEVAGSPTPMAAPKYGNLKKMTVVQGCEAILRAEGGKAKATLIRDLLVKAGKLRGSSRNNYATIVQAMKRFPEKFYNVTGSGEWRLAGYDAATTTVRPPRSISVPPNGERAVERESDEEPNNDLPSPLRTSDYLSQGTDPVVLTPLGG
jgi:hypothetical protein